MAFPINRPRRLRRNETLRRMVRETRLSPDDFIQPYFVCPGRDVAKGELDETQDPPVRRVRDAEPRRVSEGHGAGDSGGLRKEIRQTKDAERRDKVSVRSGEDTGSRQGP